MTRLVEEEEHSQPRIREGRAELVRNTICDDGATIVPFPPSNREQEGARCHLSWMDVTMACLDKNMPNSFWNQSSKKTLEVVYLIASLVAHRLTAQILFPGYTENEESSEEFPEFGVWDDFAPRVPPNNNGLSNEKTVPFGDMQDRVKYEQEYAELFCEFLEDLCHAVSEKQSSGSDR